MCDGFGKGFFSLLGFTLQMALVIILGHVVASAALIRRLLDRLADVPKTAKGAVVQVGFLAMLSSWLNWGFSLVFSAMLALATARRFAARGQAVDYRALAAASFWDWAASGRRAVGFGCASDGDAWIAAARTFGPWNPAVADDLFVAVAGFRRHRDHGGDRALYLVAPPEAHAVSAEALGISLSPPNSLALPVESLRPGEKLEHSPWLLVPFVLCRRRILCRRCGPPLEAGSGEPEHHQLDAAFVWRAAAQDTGQASAGICRGDQRGLGRHLAVSVLWRNCRDLGRGGAQHQDRWPVRRCSQPIDAATACRCVFGAAGNLCAVGGSKWLIEAPYVLRQPKGCMFTRAGWSPPTIWARRWPTWSSRFGCCRSWVFTSSKPAT